MTFILRRDNTMLRKIKIFLGKQQSFVVGALLALLMGGVHTTVQAQSGTSGSWTLGNAMSPITILFLIIGIVISILYIKSMLTVLNEAADSYSEAEDEAGGVYYSAPAWGAAIAGIISAMVIWSYGAAPMLLYLGPILVMLSPIAILYCMAQDIKEFRSTHSVAGGQQTVSKELSGMRS
ncbi:MAG: hypothetical protein HC921_14680 [Synechococcaceae cyanobacterium SM2_3_1]|nr:hypothetical protein [Synechococcaceae cyanobacterium SM2_3_1]